MPAPSRLQDVELVSLGPSHDAGISNFEHLGRLEGGGRARSSGAAASLCRPPHPRFKLTQLSSSGRWAMTRLAQLSCLSARLHRCRRSRHLVAHHRLPACTTSMMTLSSSSRIPTLIITDRLSTYRHLVAHHLVAHHHGYRRPPPRLLAKVWTVPLVSSKGQRSGSLSMIEGNSNASCVMCYSSPWPPWSRHPAERKSAFLPSSPRNARASMRTPCLVLRLGERGMSLFGHPARAVRERVLRWHRPVGSGRFCGPKPC